MNPLVAAKPTWRSLKARIFIVWHTFPWNNLREKVPKAVQRLPHLSNFPMIQSNLSLYLMTFFFLICFDFDVPFALRLVFAFAFAFLLCFHFYIIDLPVRIMETK